MQQGRVRTMTHVSEPPTGFIHAGQTRVEVVGAPAARAPAVGPVPTDSTRRAQPLTRHARLSAQTRQPLVSDVRWLLPAVRPSGGPAGSGDEVIRNR